MIRMDCVMRGTSFLIIILLFGLFTGCTGTNPRPYNEEGVTMEAPDLGGTIIPSATKSIPTITPTDVIPVFGKRTIVIQEWDSGSNYLVDLENGNIRLLDQENEIFYPERSWTNSGCSFLAISYRNQGIVERTILGDTLRFFGLDPITDIVSPSLSPNGNQVAYLQRSEESDFEVLEGSIRGTILYDLMIMNTLDLQDIISLSSGHSVTQFSWAPEENVISYNDIDGNGIQQVFIGNPETGEIQEITELNDVSRIISSIEWSPDGDRIALVSRDMTRKPDDQLYIYDSVEGTKLLEMGEDFWSIDKILWINNDEIILFGSEYQETVTKIVRRNLLTGETIRLLPTESIKNFSSPIFLPSINELVFYVTSGTTIGFFGFNIETQEIRFFVEMPGIFSKAYYGMPSTFSGLDACQ